MDKADAIIAVDIGNSFIKFGLFEVTGEPSPFPDPVSLCVETTSSFSDLAAWLVKEDLTNSRLHWTIATVHEKRMLSLKNWLKRHREEDRCSILSHQDIPLQLCYTPVASLGIDRAIAALAAQRFLNRSGPFLVVDIGTATTIDLVNREGLFLGGAILPGPQIAAQVLFEKTAQLPNLAASFSDPALVYPGTNTEDAIRLGISAGTLGSILNFYIDSILLLSERSDPIDDLPILITERGRSQLAESLQFLFHRTAFCFGNRKIPSIQTCPHLLLSGIAITAFHLLFQQEKNHVQN